MVDFDWKHRDDIYKHFDLSITESVVESLSFLRTSDPSVKGHKQHYHFLHLTFQEYFAARYFVRQWNAKLQLDYLDFNEGKTGEIERNPRGFLQQHKYTARYDILWRFVAGLLGAEGKADEFFNAIEGEPRDLLGPAHQRLVMHCLSEVSTEMQHRKSLEEKLKEWLLFECNFIHSAHLASEAEFPEQALHDALVGGSDNVKKTILRSLARRPTIPSSVTKLAASWLDYNEDSSIRQTVAYVLGGQSNQPNAILTAVAARLEDDDVSVRRAVAHALGGQSNLPEAILTAVAARLEDDDGGVETGRRVRLAWPIEPARGDPHGRGSSAGGRPQ